MAATNVWRGTPCAGHPAFNLAVAGRDVAQLIEDQQVELRELVLHPHQLTFLRSFHQQRDQFGPAMEPDLLPLPTRGDCQGRGIMGLSSSGMADQNDRLTFLDVLPTHQFADQYAVDRRLGLELEIFECFVIREDAIHRTKYDKES